ncbi:dipeptide transport system permease protein DppB [bacterium BMS3Abin07]|nr:dipeptide transport system permease protein DppB [bacterium BMS3Abin07]GBE31692.1 dipeptide transport system permease protein DppB [bacterium BMS3Bbin05]HDL20785.1 ABC transporter permease [Nitrospirota bacterium]HDO22924.1 ABC transporter permease [Nitrospirota bacterium]
MTKFLLKKSVEMLFTLFGITLLSFFIIHLAPGKPTDILTDMNPKVTPEMRERLEKYYGLDKPIVVQYGMWLKRIVRFDFGDSFSTDRRPVWDKIKERIPITLGINVLSMILIFVVAIPIGIYSAVRRYSVFDKVTTVFVFTGFAAPSFWLALLLMILFGVKLHVLPISGITSLDYDALSVWGKIWDVSRHLVLPVFVSAIGGIAGISRYMRSGMLEVIRQDYITTARAKGLPERTVTYRHALRNALLPIITILGLSVPGLIGGSVIFEQIFSIPGMGLLFYMSVMMRDYPVVMGILTIGAILTLAGNMLADISYALVDPRVRKA